VFKKNISDGGGSQNGSIDTRLYPPLFWLDNTFNLIELVPARPALPTNQ
jgi:hypothetical protein